jgi:hypothetical protein
MKQVLFSHICQKDWVFERENGSRPRPEKELAVEIQGWKLEL